MRSEQGELKASHWSIVIRGDRERIVDQWGSHVEWRLTFEGPSLCRLKHV